jgi:hypothetical protein
MRLGLRRRTHDEHLIDVRDENALPLPTTGSTASELRAPRKNLGDGPRAAGVRLIESDIVSDGELQRRRGRGDGITPQPSVGALAAVRIL